MRMPQFIELTGALYKQVFCVSNISYNVCRKLMYALNFLFFPLVPSALVTLSVTKCVDSEPVRLPNVQVKWGLVVWGKNSFLCIHDFEILNLDMFWTIWELQIRQALPYMRFHQCRDNISACHFCWRDDPHLWCAQSRECSIQLESVFGESIWIFTSFKYS